MNILQRELRRNRKSFLIWSVSMILTIVGLMSLYPSIAQDSASLDQLLKQMPPALLKAFDLDRLSMANILGYFGTRVGMIVLLGGSIYAILLGTGALAKEENDRTVEFLLSKPVTRSEVVTEKVLGYLICITLFNVILFGAAYLTFEQVKLRDYPVKTLILLGAAYLMVQITFANIGLLISVFRAKRNSLTGLALWLVLGMYFMSTVTGLTPKLDFLKYLTPFKYADAADIILNGALSKVYLVILLAVNIAAIFFSYVGYTRKNINV